MTTESFFFHLICLENESAEFYARMASHTVSMPKVRDLFSRLSEEEKTHRNMVKIARDYHAESTESISLKTDNITAIEKARQGLQELNALTEATPPLPPFLPLLHRVWEFEKDMEAQHYSTYLDITDESLRELLMQLTQYDKHHVSMITRLIQDIDRELQEGPQE